MHGSSNLLGSAVWAVDSRVHCLCSRGRQHPGSCWGSWGSSTLTFLFTHLTPSAGTALRGNLFSNHLRQDCSFCEVGHGCALTSQPGKAGAAGDGKPLETAHKCALSMSMLPAPSALLLNFYMCCSHICSYNVGTSWEWLQVVVCQVCTLSLKIIRFIKNPFLYT